MKKILSNLKPVNVIIASTVLIFGIYYAFTVKWVCDDIFITFRYVQNWLNGLGIVYNAGERVEGYTHFLWLCFIVLFQKLGINPIDSSEWLGIISYAGLLSLFLLISYRLTEKKEFYIPFTAIILALHYDFRIWVTGGLETSFFAMLITAAFFVLFYMRVDGNKKYFLTGFILTIALLTRPDAIIFYTITFVFLIIRDITKSTPLKTVLRSAVVFNLPALLIYLPYLFWRISYYGDIFPNTYYTKSGFASYYSQGFFYLYTYFKIYISSLFFLCGFVYIFILIKRSEGTAYYRIKSLLNSPKSAPIILALTYILGYGFFFIAKVGGDFMYARFVIPLIPFFYFTAEASLRELLVKWSRLLPVPFIIILFILFIDHSRRDLPAVSGTTTVNNVTMVSTNYKLGWNGIVDEHWFYTRMNPFDGLPFMNSVKKVGSIFREYFVGKEVRVLIDGGQACLAYYSQFSYCIENYGLTDSYISHLPVKERSRPGHERSAPYDYLISKKIDFSFGKFPQEYSSFQYIDFQMPNRFYQGVIITYNRELMKDLRQKFPTKILFMDFEKYLDDYIKGIKSVPYNQVKLDYKKFKDYYFSRNNDPEREKYFLEIVNR